MQEKIISRRLAIKKAAKIAAGIAGVVGTTSVSYDRASQLARRLTQPELRGALPRAIEKLKSIFPEIDQWSDPEEWASAIEHAFASTRLPETRENLCLVLTLLIAESGFRKSPRAYDYILNPTEGQVGATGLVEPKTGGPMEFSVRYVMEEEGLNYEQALKELSTIQNGVKYGVRHLKKILEIYSNIIDRDLKILSIFADYNAGPYASRNAGIQRVLNTKLQIQLREDGLIFQESREAIMNLFDKFGISLSKEQLEQDLKLLLSSKLETTPTWQAIQSLNGGNLLPVPADRPVLGAIGIAKKILTGINDSREYAIARLEEYYKVMGILEIAG